MSEIKEMIVDVVERMLKEHVDKDLVDSIEQGNWAQEVWDLFEENGMTVVAIAEKNGGAGGDLDDLLNIVKLIGKYAAPIPFPEVTLANYLLEYANLKPVEELATYRLNLNQAFILEDQKISGEAEHVPWARHTKRFVTFAKHQEDIHLVEVDLSKAEIIPSTNLASEPRDTVKFNNVQVLQLSRILSTKDIQHMMLIQTAFQLALMTGAVEKVNDLTIQYTKEREQFGRPIHRFQLVQQYIVKLAGETAIASAAFNNMINALEQDRISEVAYARIRFEEIIQEVTTGAHQVHAAIGTTHEHCLHQYTRRLWSWRDEGENIEHWLDVVATDLLTSNESDLWSYLTGTKQVEYSKE